MCKKKQFKYCPSEIDECMKDEISAINSIIDVSKFEIRACCCGHGKYPKTIIVEGFNDQMWDLVSGMDIPRKRNFYKRDKKGYYYIPETLKSGKVTE